MRAAGRATITLRLIQAAARSNPNLGQIAADMGVILERLGRFDEASESYERALSLQPDQPLAQ